MKKYKLYIFDIDGVILDSKLNMQITWNEVRKIYKLKPQFDDYFKLIGSPFLKILSKLNIKSDKIKIAKSYSQISKKNFSKIKLYPKIRRVLNKLKLHSKIAVVTSKEKRRTQFFLKKFNLKFDDISCPEKGKRGKPYPDQLLKVIKKCNIEKKDCVYIGDMKVDLVAAKNAKIDFILANYGYETRVIKKVSKINNLQDLTKYKIDKKN